MNMATDNSEENTENLLRAILAVINEDRYGGFFICEENRELIIRSRDFISKIDKAACEERLSTLENLKFYNGLEADRLRLRKEMRELETTYAWIKDRHDLYPDIDKMFRERLDTLSEQELTLVSTLQAVHIHGLKVLKGAK